MAELLRWLKHLSIIHQQNLNETRQAQSSDGPQGKDGAHAEAAKPGLLLSALLPGLGWL